MTCDEVLDKILLDLGCSSAEIRRSRLDGNLYGPSLKAEGARELSAEEVVWLVATMRAIMLMPPELVRGLVNQALAEERRESTKN